MNLPGVELAQLEALTKTDQADYNEFWAMVYERAWQNLVSDVQDDLKDRFFVDAKLLTNETSEFLEAVNSGTNAGVVIQFSLPKYARIHVVSVDIYSEAEYSSPDFVVEFREDDSGGDLLHSASGEVSAGKNTIFVDTDFEADKLFIGYDPSVYSIRKTQNKYYPLSTLSYDKLSCTFPCSFGIGSVTQIGGGGLNLKYVVYCSIEKFVCENINLFKLPLYWKIGIEILNEVRFGNNVNCFTAMTPERAIELYDFYNGEYRTKLDGSIKGLNIREDPFCFNCKNTVTHKTILP